MKPGTKVLAPMRVVPIAYSYGIVERPYDKGRYVVNMPHGKRNLSQVFNEADMIVCEEPT